MIFMSKQYRARAKIVPRCKLAGQFMDDYGKINHICKLLGIVFILLALTVFAKADTYTFDCQDPFNCSIKDYCQGISGAVPGLLVMDGGASSYLYGSEPTEYSFIANEVGLQTCQATITVTAMHDQGQTNEKSQIFINGVSVGTTIDNHCNGPEGGSCTFCGRETQTLPAKEIILEEENTLEIHGYDSHVVVAVVLTCGGGKDCSQNLSPIIDDIQDKVLPYNNGYFRMDLWNDVRDYDDSYSDINIDVSLSGTTINCNLIDKRYLECSTNGTLGTTTVTIDVIDVCEATASKTFDVKVINQLPYLAVPDQEKSCSSDMSQFIEFRYYGWDEEINTTTFNLLSQSNTTLLNCTIDNEHFLSCQVNTCDEDYSDITVRIIDIFGEYYDDTFRITLTNQKPYWFEEIDDVCFNKPSYKFLDLRDYAYDIEDKNNLTFTLTQNNKNAIDCFIEDNYYLSCNSISNQKAINTLTLKATDSKGLYATTTAEIETNCNGHFDFNSTTKYVCLEECTSYTTEITLKNNYGEKRCFNFDIENDPITFNTSLNKTSFCLNSNETTTLYLSANTCGTDNDDYEVKVFDEENNLAMYFDYEIGSCNNFDGFKIKEYDGTICKGEKRTYSVDVTNTSNETKTIFLMAENSMILPYFSKEKVTLNDGQTKTVDLTINAKYSPLRHYNIFLGGDATNYHIEKLLDLEVVDCSEISERNFLITAPDICYDVERGQTFESSFNVKRVRDTYCCECSWNTKSILLSIIGMPNELAYNLLDLRCSEEKKVDYSLNIPSNAKAGIQFVTIVGEEQVDVPFDNEIGFVEPKEICLNVLGESNSNIQLKTQTKDILWCDSEIFELELTNTGDFDESFDLSATNIPVGVTVFFSQDTVTVLKNTSKIIYVSISTAPESQIADNQFITVNLYGNIDLSTKIYFNIKEKLAFEDLEFMSSTELLTMKTNSEAKYFLMIRNNTEKTLRNITLYFENLPSDVNAQELILSELASGGTVMLEGKIISDDTNGIFYPMFVISSGSIKNKEQFTLVIEKSEENAGLAGINGFFGLTGLFSFGELSIAIGLAVFLILLLLVIILGLIAVSKNNRKEEWVGS